MFGFSFFKLPKARQYNHKPIYYDPEKEEREQKLKQNNVNADSERRINFRKNKQARKDTTKTNIRLIAIIIALIFLAIYFLYS